MSFRVIGLSGPAGCGKDTAAHHLKNHYGFAVYAFAFPLKSALNALFGWPPSLWENREWKERVQPDIGKSPRQLAQTLGTEWGRNLVNPDLWLILAQRACNEAKLAGLDGIVFTDCRFRNEAEFVRSQNGLVIAISRDSVTPVAGHVSETPLPEHLVDAIVINDSTLEEYYAALRNVVRYWPTRDVPSGTLDPAAGRCGHMSRTKRVCVLGEGHTQFHSDGVANWHPTEG